MSLEPEYIGTFPLFASLSLESRSAIAEQLLRRSVRRGEKLFVVMGPGEVFGELSLFDPGPRTATASAVVGSEVASLDHAELTKLLEGRPETATLLLRVLARRLRRTNDAMSDLVFTDVPGRVAKALLDLASQFGTHDRGQALRVEH